MPRDINGNYLLPVGNPVQSGSLVESNWANTTMADLATEMTDSLSRSGKGGLTGPVGIVDLSGAIPGLNFVNEPTSGLKRVASGDVRMQILGGDRMRWRSGVAQRPEVQVDAVWQPVAIEPADRKVMYGEGGVTASWFYNNTVPPGWMLSNPDTNLRNLSIAPGGATPVGGGTIDGVDDPTGINYSKDVTPAGTVGSGGAHTPTVASMGGASNTVNADIGGTPGKVACAAPGHSHSTTLDPVPAHDDHVFTGVANSVDIAFNPRRAMGVIGVLDA